MQVDVKKIDPRKLVRLERNAHFMTHETFARLTGNVKEDQALTSTPFCAPLDYYTAEDTLPRDDEGEIVFEVLSGNHRVMSAIEAGLDWVWILYTEEPLTQDQRLAIQLSHNAIFGQDDPAILRELYDSIQDLDLRAYSGLDDKTLELLEDVQITGLSEASLSFQVITFAFLPEEIAEVKRVFDEVKLLAAGDELWLARWGAYDDFLSTLDDASTAVNVRNVATSLQAILSLADGHKQELADGWFDGDGVKHNGWVPIATVTNTSKIPAKGAARLMKAIDQMVSAGEVESKERWRALVLLADRYLTEA